MSFIIDSSSLFCSKDQYLLDGSHWMIFASMVFLPATHLLDRGLFHTFILLPILCVVLSKFKDGMQMMKVMK